VGARNFLVAYNLLLETTDVSVAKQIARRVRESGGGFKGVKALGVMVRGRAQVTLNVTNFHEAPVERVFESVKRLAAEYGTGIREGELIGLVPEAALSAGTEWTKAIPGYTPETKVLERRLQQPMGWPE
jgi:glutamate formiminotransferase